VQASIVIIEGEKAAGKLQRRVVAFAGTPWCSEGVTGSPCDEGSYEHGSGSIFDVDACT
jgi:hypothetical protein